MNVKKPTLHIGETYTDVRGILKYINEEKPGYYRRFYLIIHPDISTIRAWQGHKKEEKAFYVISGSFVIAVINPENFDTPDDDEKPEFFSLTPENNYFLRVPGGNYTGMKAFIPGSTLLVLSGLDLAASKEDDFRQPADKWVDWSTLHFDS